VDFDLSGLSKRVAQTHCRLWLFRGTYILYNRSPRKDTFFGEVQATEPKSATTDDDTVWVSVTVPDEQTVFVLLTQIKVEAQIDVAKHWILLVDPAEPDGHVLIRFVPEGNDFKMEVKACKVLKLS